MMTIFCAPSEVTGIMSDCDFARGEGGARGRLTGGGRGRGRGGTSTGTREDGKGRISMSGFMT